MTLQISNMNGEVSIYVDGKLVWRGSLGEWSKAISMKGIGHGNTPDEPRAA